MKTVTVHIDDDIFKQLGKIMKQRAELNMCGLDFQILKLIGQAIVQGAEEVRIIPKPTNRILRVDPLSVGMKTKRN